jgi:hypothetical protein
MRGAVERRSLSRIRGTRWGRQGAIALALAWVIFAVGDWWLGPPNVAFHKPVLVSGTPTSPAGELVDGVTDKSRPVIILGQSAAATIDLGGPYAIRNVRVFDRQDGAFDSNLPLSLETSLDGNAWSLWVRRRDHFSVWNEKLHGARARYVRLRTDRSELALNEIEIYGSFAR